MKFLRALFVVLVVLLPAGALFSGGVADAHTEEQSILPVTDIVLYNTGIGFFQRSGTIIDTQTVDIIFDSASVNDLLKSLVVSDLDDGTVSWVNYASREPVLQSLQTLSVNLAANPPFLQILAQLRGERVTLEYENGGSATGAIVGIENSNDGTRINILDDRDRIRSIDASVIRSFTCSDPMVREELERALVLLAESKYKDAKRVSVRFAGAGSRRVNLGYALPVPVWKASYRLVLGEDEHLFQAWAIVENMTREDWREVSISLVSGLPISFQMDLYRPIYVNRPSVNVDIATSVAPPTYEDESRFAADLSVSPSTAMRSAPKAATGYALSEMGAGAADEGGFSSLNMADGVEPAATGSVAGEYFQYRISEPVTLARNESGMIPISSGFIDGAKLSIYNASTHPTHPLHSFRIVNSTDFDFVGGPVTIFESGAYAGDSTINVLRAGEDTLISYAVDLSSAINVQYTADHEKLTGASIFQGILETEERAEKQTSYLVLWEHEDGRELLIEQPVAGGWNAIEPSEVDEKTDSYYRFIINPAESPELRVVEERIRKNSFRLESASDNTIRRYAENDDVSVAVRDALNGILTRKTEITNLVQLIRAHENRRSEIFRDQQRIRENLAKVSEDSEIYARYLEQLDSQEDELEIIAFNIQNYLEREQQLREDLAEYIRNLQA